MKNKHKPDQGGKSPYRILSPTAILGYGFPEASFRKAMDLDIDLIAVDAGSMDAGPHYLGSGSQYAGSAALARDLSYLVNGALQQGCPLVVGSAGFSGATPAMDEVVEIIKALLQSAGADAAKLAVIKSDIEPAETGLTVDKLEALGSMPELSQEVLESSALVGQMGMEPIIAALQAGAQFVVCGRAYDPAVFAADPVSKGFPVGPTLHAAKILECGAIACEPGSGSDCLIAELYQDGRAEFFSPNERRKATVKSLAAHTLYEKSRPDLFLLPGGLLDIRETRFYESGEHRAGFSGSRFIPMPYSIKLEGCVPAGVRCISLAFARHGDIAEVSVLEYGRNGVEKNPAPDGLEESGILCEVKGSNRQQTKETLAFVRSTLLHVAYPGRIATAGNLALPFSPSDFVFADGEKGFTGIFIAGTRDPVFRKNLQQAFQMVREALQDQHPDLASNCRVQFHLGEKNSPLLVVETIDDTPAAAVAANIQIMAGMENIVDNERPVYQAIEGGLCYQWSVHHLLKDKDIIEKLFPVEIFQRQEQGWVCLEKVNAAYNHDVTLTETRPATETEIGEHVPEAFPSTATYSCSLQDLALVVRSKNAGINELTFDVLFKTEEGFRSALDSGVFSRQSIADLFQIKNAEVLGSYGYSPANAIKFTLLRPQVSGTQGERDVFGAQQHTRLLGLQIPMDGKASPE